MAITVSKHTGDMDFAYTIDFSEIDGAIKQMDKDAAKLIKKAIKKVFTKEKQNTKKRLSSGRYANMGGKVADSLDVEEVKESNKFGIRFGSQPINSGGATGSRGGKLAQYLEYGVRRHPYSFKGLEITNRSGSMGFINALKTPYHPGIRPQEWLTRTYERVNPQIPDAIQQALNEAWKGGGN